DKAADRAGLRRELLAFRSEKYHYPDLQIEAARLLRPLPSPLDRHPVLREYNLTRDTETMRIPIVGEIGDARLRHWGGVLALAYAPNGKLFASSGEDRVVRLWDPRTGELIEPHGYPGPPPDRVEGLAFSPNSSLLAGTSPRGTVVVWDLDSHKLL